MDHRAISGLQFASAAYRYRGTGGALVRRLKLGGDLAALEALARAMARVAAPRLVGAFRSPVLVPVPLHRSRRRQRGFDQAELLAAGIGVRLSLRCGVGVLARVRPTLPQGDPRVTSRASNVAAAFAIARPADVRGRAVLLVDDVMTSGATARTCADLLGEAGATGVALLTACRARTLAPMASS